MPVVRIYLPVGRDDLVDLDQRRELPASSAGPRTGYRVSAELQRAEPSFDTEALEYAAFCEAVAAAGATRPAAGGLVVIAADVDSAWLVDTPPDAPHRTPCSVGLAQTLPIKRVASFHVGDDESTGSDDEPDAGDLLWYDVTELREVLGLRG